MKGTSRKLHYINTVKNAVLYKEYREQLKTEFCKEFCIDYCGT